MFNRRIRDIDALSNIIILIILIILIFALTANQRRTTLCCRERGYAGSERVGRDLRCFTIDDETGLKVYAVYGMCRSDAPQRNGDE